MSHRVTVQPSGNVFEVPEGDTILAAALNEGFHLPYGCRNGACGSCKGKIITGEIDYGKYQHSALSDDERAAGYALFCQARPLTDLTIESREIGAVKDIVVKKLPCRVHKLERVADDRSEEHTSELQSRGHLVCRLLLEKKKTQHQRSHIRHENTATQNTTSK